MKDKYIPDLIMSILDKKHSEMQKFINTPFTPFNNGEYDATVEGCTAVQLSFLRDTLEDIFGEEK